MTPFIVAIAGALGALSRYAMEGFVGRHHTGSFPVSTFVVNISGSLALGIFLAIAVDKIPTASPIRAGVTVGFLGAFTTFSTLSLETYRLLQDGAHLTAVLNALGSLVVGLVAVGVGFLIGRLAG